jgi:hypothetical protein
MPGLAGAQPGGRVPGVSFCYRNLSFERLGFAPAQIDGYLNVVVGLCSQNRCWAPLLLLLLCLDIRELIGRCVPGQSKRSQPFSLLPGSTHLGLIVCPSLRAFPGSLLLLVLGFLRHGKGGLLREFDPCPFASKALSAACRSSLRQLNDLVDALDMVIHTDMNERVALFNCHPGGLGRFKRGIRALGLPIYLEPESTLNRFALRRGFRRSAFTLVFLGKSRCHPGNLLIVAQIPRST